MTIPPVDRIDELIDLLETYMNPLSPSMLAYSSWSNAYDIWKDVGTYEWYASPTQKTLVLMLRAFAKNSDQTNT